ncbi:probable disease resistance protein At5g66900 [Lactuca sativa]|uniref:probable disease resistance protein At5g66900 n=1 Tax=Lactuca sativa TaxID=4236 RepID=UPI000CC913FB|nr:probable disease resistance protein At5g66900 [Lactuca sativa]
MAMLLDALLSESISTLTTLVISVVQTTANFKPELELLGLTLQRIKPIIDEIVNMKRKLDRTELECKMFIEEIQEAEKLVAECSKIKRNIIKKFTYSLKLKVLNSKMLSFFQIEVQASQSRDIMHILSVVNDMKLKVDRIFEEQRDTTQSTGRVGNHRGSESTEREKYGWRVPILPSLIVAFGEPLEKLKAAVGDDHPVLVVAAPGGCGKTTLAKMLCHDAEIGEKFGENIFFVTVSETPNLMMIISDLFNPNPSDPRLLFQSKGDAKNKLENFLNEKASDPMLLVLDDVWSDSFIEQIFPSNIRGHKIVVTSRTAFQKYKTFRFEPLNDEDAKSLFRSSAFTESGSRPSPTINDDLVNQMVPWCKKHPLTLSVVGRSLNGKDELVWKSMLKKLSRGRSVLDLHEDVFIGLERSFESLDEELKQCFLDFGLFPEDQRIPVSVLLNMWVHLYDHDDEGVDTMATIFELSYRNLVDLMTTGFRNDSSARVNYCDQQLVTQHDLLRELAIHLNSKLPLAKRTRLSINVRGDEFPTPIKQLQESMQARILSISTGESFSSKWCNMEIPNLEVLILNMMSKTYTLPHFLAANPKLKSLNITNHGLYLTKFNNFHFLTSSHNLTRIRLERVDISPSILSLISLQKVSLIMCKIGNTFKNLITKTPNIWPQLVELEIDYCQDLVEFPGTLCNSDHLKKNSITNCNDLCGFSEEFGDLINLEMLSLRSCTKLKKLPESIWRLRNLSVLDISDCLNLSGLPEKMGKLGCLRKIYMKGCSGVNELPESVEELSHVRVVCNEEVAYKWRGYSNVEIDLVEENPLETLERMMSF